MTSTTTRKTVTKRDAEKFLAAVKRQFKAYLPKPDAKYATGPSLREDWDWLGTGGVAKWSIVWEEGPFQWTYAFPYGGVDQEFGGSFKDVSEGLPNHVFAEAITSWAVGLYVI